jgi:hypothetical protein
MRMFWWRSIWMAALLSLGGCGMFGAREPREGAGSTSQTARTPYEQTLSSWFYRPEQELVASWGVPDRSQRLTDGGQALQYFRLDGDGKILCTTLFTSDALGKIRSWTYRGSDCRPPRLGDYGAKS